MIAQNFATFEKFARELATQRNTAVFFYRAIWSIDKGTVEGIFLQSNIYDTISQAQL